jgi:DNA-binding NarL/FixJ family response regulator
MLLVDDHEAFRAAARAVVAATDGFTLVGEATTGAQALELLPTLQPQLVLMDVRMPGMSGVEASRAIVERSPGTVVVLLSATDSPTADLATEGVLIIDKQLLSPALLRSAWDGAHAVT